MLFSKKLMAASLLLLAQSAIGQNFGFEAPPSTPPLNWVAVTGTWRTINDTVRTGNQAMAITAPATTGTTAGSGPAAQILNSSGNTFIVTILWARSNEASNARVNIGYRRGTTNTLNPSITTSGQAPNMGLDWTRIASASTGPVAAGTAGPAIRAFRSQTNPPGTTIYIDDMWIYESTTADIDTFAPLPLGSPIFTSANGMSWVNRPDSNQFASGRAGVVIVRATGTNLPAPSLNDQASYALVQGEAGVASFIQNGNTWQVVGVITDTSVTTFTDANAVPGTNYTYFVFNMDRARNYSPGSRVLPGCTGQPTVGAITMSTPVQRCVGDSVIITATGSIDPSIQYQWEQAPASGGSFTVVPGASGTSIRTVASSSMRYRRVAGCGASGLGDTSNIVQTSVQPNVVTGPISSSFQGFTYTFSLNSALNFNSLTWNFDDGTTDTGRTVTHTFTSNRTFIVRVVGQNSCSIDSTATAINISGVNTQELKALDKLKIYPNPATELMHIELPQEVATIEIMNLQGQVVRKLQQPQGTKIPIAINDLAVGTYLVQATAFNGEQFSLKFQINR